MKNNANGTYYGTANLLAKGKDLVVGKNYLISINGLLANVYEPSTGDFLCQIEYRAFNNLKKAERM